MLKDFKQFILRGNVVDLAIAVVIGAAFNELIQAFVKDIITPFIAMFGGKPDFTKFKLTINGAEFLYGNFITLLISFLITAAVVFFFVVQPLNRLMRIVKKDEPDKPEPTTRKCPECISDIPKAATRCAFCTAVITPQIKSRGVNA